MLLHERVKNIREEKRFSQDFIAHELGLSQSQYSRRESGEIKFNADEVLNLSKVLATHISDLYGEPALTFNNNTQQGGVFGQYVTIPDKLIEQYEKRLQEKDELITLLKKQLK